MAHKKGASSSRNGRDSNPQYLGVKKFGAGRLLRFAASKGLTFRAFLSI